MQYREQARKKSWKSGLMTMTALSVLFIPTLTIVHVGTAHAQETTVQSDAEKSIMKEFTVQSSTGMELPKGQVTRFISKISQKPEGLSEDPSGVNLEGSIGYVEHNNKKIMVTIIDRISKGENEVSLPRRIEAQSFVDKPIVTSTQPIRLTADPAQLDAALRELAAMQKEEPKAKEQPDTAQIQPDNSSNRSSNGSGSGGGGTGSGNGLAGSYQNPQQADFKNPKKETRVTKDGCQIRLDKDQKVAVAQHKVQYFEDGKMTKEDSCIDSEVRYPLQTSFDGCRDIVDVNSLTVYRQSKTYYNKDGSRVNVSSCAKDTSSTFKIVENTQGCAPVVDRAGRKVTVYATLVYTGASNSVINVRSCAPSTTQPAYNLQKSYESCTHQIDLPNKFAYGRYKDYYVNKLATRVEVSDCEVDTKKKWAITEREGSCKVFLDWTKDNERVFKQSVMEYTDDKAVKNEARGCDKSTLTDPVKMVKDTNLCSIRHDFEQKQSHQMFLWKYTLDGVAYQASACGDTEVVYNHLNYTLGPSGAKVCTPNVDQSAKLVTLFYRTGIVVNENRRYITECKPDSQNKLKVVATTDGCTDPATWQHDLKASFSYENQRWYYTLNGKREYVTVCQKGTKTYRHDQTIIGWQLHDDKLYALPISKVVIKGTPIGEYVVSVNTVLDGAVQQPYVLKKTIQRVDNPNGPVLSYQGCLYAFIRSDKYNVYERPTGTTFEKRIGDGKPVNRGGNHCKRSYYGNTWLKVVKTGDREVPCPPGTDIGRKVISTFDYQTWQKYNLVHTVNNNIVTTGLEAVIESETLERTTHNTCRADNS